ncbi:Solute carrier family 22 member [Echinococcus multilocularis]|uniref:Solute carrier family 22 member n=1 Tax=Echinococcus multilocularis TaxID=6211 RepID=A0A0S4MKF2_ECHMU|nr:Solute carrier family 22 member [Echinococcus multilocularis]
MLLDGLTLSFSSPISSYFIPRAWLAAPAGKLGKLGFLGANLRGLNNGKSKPRSHSNPTLYEIQPVLVLAHSKITFVILQWLVYTHVSWEKRGGYWAIRPHMRQQQMTGITGDE